ncbi:MAG: endolytic transglycosylase MltG [Patescibacteria group bacterium]
MRHILGHKRWAVAGVVVLFCLLSYAYLFGSPTAFPTGEIFVVKKGDPAPVIAQKLAAARLIRHESLFPYVLRLFGSATTVQAGAYNFSKPQSSLLIAWRLGHGDYGIPPARITIFEGLTVREIADRVADALPEISAEEVRVAGKEYEGYLFPDTYIFPPGADADSVVQAMRTTFDAKIAPYAAEIRASGRRLSDIVIMASLLEREARTLETKRVISGILWRRLLIDMPLQVDAVFGYIFARPTYSPSYEDLKVDSPYNTYLYRGLPPGPICNPGLESIEAALHPTKTPYLYYLTDRDGVMRYAATYAGHQANQAKYLSR